MKAVVFRFPLTVITGGGHPKPVALFDPARVEKAERKTRRRPRRRDDLAKAA